MRNKYTKSGSLCLHCPFLPELDTLIATDVLATSLKGTSLDCCFPKRMPLKNQSYGMVLGNKEQGRY